MAKEIPYLPPLRKKIQRAYLIQMSLYGILGLFFILALFSASKTGTRLIKANYDSIAVAAKMRDAWNGIQDPKTAPEMGEKAWTQQFEEALIFEENNITEDGETKIAQNIRSLWEKAKINDFALPSKESNKMYAFLDMLLRINEKGMFHRVEESRRFTFEVVIGGGIIFLVILFTNIFLADSLAQRISYPLKAFAETLRSKPDPEKPLKLPLPNSLELNILHQELNRLWDRLAEFRKFNIEEIIAQSRKLEAVLESVEDAILVVDNRNTVIQCNAGIPKILGISAEAIIGHVWTDLSTAGENYLKLKKFLVEDLDKDKTIELIVAGRRRIYAGREKVITGKTVPVIGVLYLLHDITEIKLREKLREEFISVLSHELKTPLQSLGTAAELMLAQRSQFGDDIQLLVDTIHEDVVRIRSVANEFIQVGKFEIHSIQIKMEKVSLPLLLPEWIKPFRVVALDRHIQIDYQSHVEDGTWSLIDPIKFPWVISNLLSNAIRVSPQNGKIDITIREESGILELSVCDEGPGIDEAIRDRIFDPGFQDTSHKDQNLAGFLGLGLSIVKEIVEVHDGLIEYFPNQPKGSKFRVSLPVFYS